MSDIHAMKIQDVSGTPQGVLFENGCPTVRDYLVGISEGDIAGHTPWSKIGYTPTMTTTDSDIWSAAGSYVFPAAAAGMELVSSDNAQDKAVVIKGNAQGASAVLCDVGGSDTTLNDADVDFTAATAVAVGDILTIDSAGTSPEWAYITGVAQHTLTFSGGLSAGGSCATARSYSVVDYTAHTGATIVKIDYLTAALAEKKEIIKLNGTGVVTTVNTDIYRINSFRIIGAGSGNKPVGNLLIRGLSGGTTYSYITAGFTRARNSAYTVPAGKALHINKVDAAFGVSGNSKVEYARLYTRANREPTTGFLTGSIFYPYLEVIATNNTQFIELRVPTKFASGTDIKVSGLASSAGVATVALRGWLETL